jgi:hypothetical protein
LRLSLPPRGAAQVLLLTVVFTATFSIAVPWLLTSTYRTHLKPLDWYPETNRGGDYLVTYAAANRLRAGLPLNPGAEKYGAPYDQDGGGPYAYPPPHAYAFVPLSALPWEISYPLWEALTLALIVASCVLASRITRYPWVSLACLLLVYAQASFTQFQLERGQTDALTLFFTVLTVYLYVTRPRNPYLVGFILASGALFKLLPGALALFFLLRRDIRVLAAAAATAAVLVILTGVDHWVYWFTTALPYYRDYFLGMNVDHSLSYLLEGATDLPTALMVSRVLAVILVVAYCALVILNRERGRYLLLELAILTTIVEVATPWSANYKLIVLLFFFLAPIALLEVEFVRRRPVLFQLPLLLGWVMLVPLFGEYLTRLPYSLLVNVLPSPVILSNPLDPFITDRKVAVALVFSLLYLIGIYFVVAANSWKASGTVIRQLAAHPWPCRNWHRAAVIASVAALGLLGGSTALAASRYSVEAGQFEAVADGFAERRINDSVSLAGYRIRRDAPTHYQIDFLFRSYAPMPHNLQIFLHARQPDASGQLNTVNGRNFFPSIVTSFWPAAHYVVASTDVFFSPVQYALGVGFFDLSDGTIYGEATTDVIDFSQF